MYLRYYRFRTLNPLDLDTIINSIKTNRVIIAHEDNITNGFGAEEHLEL